MNKPETLPENPKRNDYHLLVAEPEMFAAALQAAVKAGWEPPGAGPLVLASGGGKPQRLASLLRYTGLVSSSTPQNEEG